MRLHLARVLMGRLLGRMLVARMSETVNIRLSVNGETFRTALRRAKRLRISCAKGSS